jgi:hypothetical protein
MEPYNLFRTRAGECLICAVPEGRAVPAFLTGRRWSYKGRLDSARTTPLGFDARAARTGVRFNGFYLFADFAKDRPTP